MTYEENQYLIHYGIKGQKHGVRRYQNEDGTLTPEGQERYGGKENYSKKDDGVFRTLAKTSLYGRRSTANYIEKRSKNSASRNASDAKIMRDAANRATNQREKDRLNNKAQKLERKSEKAKERYEAQSAANSDRKAYEDHTSTKKLVAQDFIFGKHGAQNYRAARARGSGRARAFLESTAGVGLLGTALAARGNKKKYGKRLVLSDEKGNDYNALAMDRD